MGRPGLTIDVTQDIVCAIATGSTKGFGFQLNAYSPPNEECAYQQYVIALLGSELKGAVNNWTLQGIEGKSLFIHKFDLVSLPNGVPTGYRLTISLQNDTANNVSGVTFTVVDNLGNTVANVTKTLTSLGDVSASDLAPIAAFELDLVGPINSEGAVLSSGSGTFTYEATTPLTALTSDPDEIAPPACTETMLITAETANSLYSAIPEGVSGTLTQSFSVPRVESLMIRRKPTLPGLILPARSG